MSSTWCPAKALWAVLVNLWERSRPRGFRDSYLNLDRLWESTKDPPKQDEDQRGAGTGGRRR